MGRVWGSNRPAPDQLPLNFYETFEPFVIGGNTWESGNLTVHSIIDKFNGIIDEVCVYNRALSQSEIQTIMGN